MPTAATPHDEMLSPATVGAELNIHPASVRRLIANGELPGYRIGKRHVRVYRSDLERFKRAQPIAAPTWDLVHGADDLDGLGGASE